MEDQRTVAEVKLQATAAERFAEQLRALRAGVGDPSFRKMAGRSGRISHTTLHEAAAGTRFPSWETTREFVRACEADEGEWRVRWEDAQGSGTPEPATTADLVPVASRALTVATPPPTPQVITVPRRHWWRWLAAATVVAVVVILGLAAARSRGRADAAGGTPSSGASDTLIPGDASRFVGDVTIPDGTRVKAKSHFVKVWAFANVGSVAWHRRFLAPAQPTGDDDGCQVPSRVAIGDTLPGETVMVSVPVTAPRRPGRCWVSFKMVDENGRIYFPSRRPVYFLVNVTA
jgi:hypothetical protein